MSFPVSEWYSLFVFKRIPVKLFGKDSVESKLSVHVAAGDGRKDDEHRSGPGEWPGPVSDPCLFVGVVAPHQVGDFVLTQNTWVEAIAAIDIILAETESTRRRCAFT